MDNNFDDDTNQTSNDEFVKINLKDVSRNYKDFFKSFFCNPVTFLRTIAKSKDNKFFGTAFFVLLFWIFVTFIHSLFKNSFVYDGLSYFLVVLRDLTIPILSIGFLALIIYCMKSDKDNNVSLTNSLTAVIVCKIPVIISSFLSLLTLISNKAYFLTKPIEYFCSSLSIVLTFFAVKYLFKESEDGKSFKVFLSIEVIFYIVYIFLSFLDIYLV